MMCGWEDFDVVHDIFCFGHTVCSHCAIANISRYSVFDIIVPLGSGHIKKSSSSHGVREMDRKKSPPSNWYNGVAEDGSHDNRSNYSRAHHRRYVDMSCMHITMVMV